MKVFTVIFIATLFFMSPITKSQNIYKQLKPKKENYSPLPCGEIKPTGWIRQQMVEDLEGFVGNLDKLVPGLILDDDIYGKNRLSKTVKTKNLGNIIDGTGWEVQLLWWNSETQSNWWDGYIRNAFLTDDSAHIINIRKYVQRILATQDEDGYLGIYQPDLRYNFHDENGELWSKATLLRGLLAYYEFTNDQAVLESVERAVQNVMENYPIHTSSPFKVDKPSAGGVSHGLVFTDVLDKLHQITGNEDYWSYALFLYEDYSKNNLGEKDVQYENIINPDFHLSGHGVHTYEHLRPLSVAAWSSGNPYLLNALAIYQEKIKKCLTPTGGPIGDEWIVGRNADATKTGYEYCSIHEMMDSYCLLLQKSGNAEYSDDIERIFFNAAQGARHPEKSCIAYLKTDNSYEMTGTLNGEPDPENKQTRYKYSPAHQDVAVCCVPNAGRITPYFVQNMWLKDKNEIAATLLGPSEVNTTISGNPVKIIEQTDYPYKNTFHFDVQVEKPFRFTLKIRKPSWVKNVKTNYVFTEKDGFLLFTKKWEGVERLFVEFEADIAKSESGNQTWFTYGALVLALPVEPVEIPDRIYATGFQDYKYSSVEKVVYEYKNGMVEKLPGELRFSAVLYNPVKGTTEEKFLIPVSKTILRQVTF